MKGAAASTAPRPLWQTYLLFLGPLVLTNVLQALSGTVNNIYVGRMLGVGPMAAVAGFFPVLLFFLSFVIGLGAGASVLAGQAWGAQDRVKLRRIARTVLGAGLLLGACVGLCGVLVAQPLLRWLGTPAEVMPAAVAYARVMMAALPLLFMSMLASALLRGVGDTVAPLRMLVVVCGVSALATPLLIGGWGGLPGLGVVGAACATVLATAVSLAWLVWYLRRRDHVLAPRRRRWRRGLHIHGGLLRTTVRLGVPTGLFFVTGSMADIALLSVINGHGAHATAAWGVVNQIMAYIHFPAMSIAITASILAAQAIGAGRFERVAQVTRTGLVVNLVMVGTVALLMVLLARPLARLFITDPAVVELAAGVLHITVWGSVIFGMASVFSGVMRASGTVLVPTLLSLACLALLLVPLGLLFGHLLGLRAIWAAYPATFLCALVLQASYFHLVWRHKPIRRLV